MRIIGNRGNTARKVQAVASGALASGDTVVVNADGTVSAVVASDQAVGSFSVFESATTSQIGATFDSNSNKVVISYRDTGNSNYGTAVVGTVDPSDNSISFGTPAVFESATVNDTTATFDSNSNKVVIAYKDDGNSGYGTAVVGTVSGTDISFGTPVVFESVSTTHIGSTFDTNSNKVVIAYADNGAPRHGHAIIGTVSGTGISFGTTVVFSAGNTSDCSPTFDSNSNKVLISYKDFEGDTVGRAIVGTVSNTSISFGTSAVFATGNSSAVSTAFDSNSNKHVIAFTDGGNSTQGTAIVATISGTSVSFGSKVVYNTGNSTNITPVFDANANKIVIFYGDAGNSNYGTFVVGSVSGTDISFGSEVVFNTAETSGNPAIFDSNSNRTVVAFQNGGNSYYGTAFVLQPASTNITTENYIGIASNGYATGQAATINAKGFIDDNQSSLTAGQSYYVQTNGDLGLTAADPSVFAGTAVSATKLIVKG